MLHTTRGIVLRTIKYNDSSVITNIYTELFGLQGYLVRREKSKSGSGKIALLQPLNCLELTVQHKTNSTLHRIKELRTSPAFTDIPYNTLKSSLAIFLAEVIYRSVKEEESNLPLFDFLFISANLLDEEKENCSNFHIAFLVQLSGFLGFSPGNFYSEKNPFFDLEEGIFRNEKPIHPYFLNPREAEQFSLFMSCSLENHRSISIQKEQRKNLLAALMDYYRLHLQGMSEVKSHKVLEEVMQ